MTIYRQHFNVCLCPQLCHSDLVKSIKMVGLIEKPYKCQKIIRGRQGSVIPSSYIVVMRDHSNMSEMVSEYTQCYVLSYITYCS